MEKDNELKKGSYLIYAILFVVILILTGVTITYAFFKVDTSYSSTLGGVTASMECIDIKYSETGTIDLDYSYPISDEYALANIVPVTVSVTNNCVNNTSDLTYALSLTSLSNTGKYISDDKIRINVKRKLGSAAETTLTNTGYLNSLTKLTSGNAYTYLTSDLNNRASVNGYANRTSYTLDSGTLANGITNTYKVYLWVDYYEGDTTHTGQNDNSTQDHTFAAAISLIVNPGS